MNFSIHRVTAVSVEREEVKTGTFWLKITTVSDDGECNEITLFPVDELRDKTPAEILGLAKEEEPQS